MRIDKITLNNFKQYYGLNNTIDLTPTIDKNIILIGGKNGYGKTNFLLALVWCLYGEDIAKIDENFKKEIRKDGNYSKFLKSSLNWDALKNGVTTFSVEIKISNIELPNTFNIQANKNYECKITRTFNINEQCDILNLEIVGFKKQPITTDEEKIKFIHDYLIPLEAAKFVFFDAEKIASWAELSTKEEGSVLNDALGKILGLDVYEELINDLEIYTDSLRKESATIQVKQQIISIEKGIELNNEKVEELEKQMIDTEYEILNLREDILQYQNFLINYVKKIATAISLDELYKKKDELKRVEKDVYSKFNDLSELIPIAICAGKLEEVNDHITKQDEVSYIKEQQNELNEKNNDFVEKLFNTAPFPNEGDIPFSKKMFYADKAKRIIEIIFGKEDNPNELNFEHDINKSDKEFIIETFRFIQSQSKDVFEQTIESFNRVKSEYLEVDRTIKKIESDLEDEQVIEYTNKRKDAERKIERKIEEKGSFQNQKESLKKETEKMKLSLQILLKKVSVSEHKKKKLDKANSYIKSLEDFVKEQKGNKCALLGEAIFSELKKLMHKLNDNENQSFIAAVKAETLPDNDGLKITLYSKDGDIRAKESLSQGEKQIYISCLIKSILLLSIQEYPIFIDTPLGRLDDEHIKKILLYYYPDLASQVVLMATNNEIPPSRYKMVKENVAQVYLLENINNRTKFKAGYFQSHEN